MSKKTDAAELIGGLFKEVTVLVSRKRTDGNYGSYDVSYGATINVPPDGDVDQLAMALDAYLTASVAESMKQKQEDMPQAEEVPVLHNAPAKSAPREVRTPIDDSGAEYDIFDVASIAVEYSPGGEKRAKVKGGKWAKFGVMCWPEVLSLEPLEWNLDELDAVEYSVPAGLKAKALMVDGKPKKVVEWL